MGHSYNVKIVKKEWLEACLLQGRRVDEEAYLPEIVQNNQSLSEKDLQKIRKQYNVKTGLFKNMTFIINRETFPDIYPIIASYGEFDTKEALFEYMTRTIIENGGKVLTTNTRSHYILTDDGADKQIWDRLATGSMVDHMDRKIVHFRWVMKCIAKNQLVDDSDQMHLLPLP